MKIPPPLPLLTMSDSSSTTTTAQNLQQIRQEVLARHYQAAKEELTAYVRQAPLQQQFTLASVCPTAEIAQHVAEKFTKEGMTTTVAKSGWLFTSYQLSVEVPLGSLMPVKPAEAAPIVPSAPESV